MYHVPLLVGDGVSQAADIVVLDDESCVVVMEKSVKKIFNELMVNSTFCWVNHESVYYHAISLTGRNTAVVSIFSSWLSRRNDTRRYSCVI